MPSTLTLTPSTHAPRPAIFPAWALRWAQHKVFAVDETVTGVLQILFSTEIGARQHIAENEGFLSSYYGYAPEPSPVDLAQIAPVRRFVILDNVTTDLYDKVGRPSFRRVGN